MSPKTFWFSAAILLVLFGNAAAEPSRYRAQPERARVWVIDAGELRVEQAGQARRVITLPEWQWAAEPYACAPDIALGPRGEAIVTSNVLPVLWKIDPETLKVSMHRIELDSDTDKDVGFSGLVYSERNGAYFAVSGPHGSLWRIDPLLRRAQKVGLSQSLRGACAVSVQRQERPSIFSRLCVRGESISLAPDQRSAYVQPAGCSSNAFALIEGSR